MAAAPCKQNINTKDFLEILEVKMFWISNEEISRRDFDIEKIAEQGMFFYPHEGSHAPSHLYSFLDYVCEYLLYKNKELESFFLDDLIPYMWYFWAKDWMKYPSYIISEKIERFILKINQPMYSSLIYVNISIYDSHYLKERLKDRKFPDGTPMGDYIREIQEFQKLFMIKANKMRNSYMVINPSFTIFLYRKGEKFEDPDFVRWLGASNLHVIL